MPALGAEVACWAAPLLSPPQKKFLCTPLVEQYAFRYHFSFHYLGTRNVSENTFETVVLCCRVNSIAPGVIYSKTAQEPSQ